MTTHGHSEAGAPYAGALGSDVSWHLVPEAPVDAASCFDPSLASIPKVSLPTPPKAAAPAQLPQQHAQQAQLPQQQVQPLHAHAQPSQPQAQPQQHAQLPPQETSDEERAWLEAVAKAKSQTSEQEQVVAAACSEQESEEDWEALMAAARQRAEAEATPVARVLAEARVRAKSAPPSASAPSPIFAVASQPEPPLDAASAQVERGAVAANDRLPAQLHTVPVVAEIPEDEEWKRLRAEVEAKDRAESERKLRAMQEIRRLRGNRGNTGNVPTTAPPIRRFAAGTNGPPVQAAGKKRAVIVAPAPAPARTKQSLGATATIVPPAPARSKRSIGATTTRSLPRITQRLNNGS